jgi:hypothetical protein
LHERLELAEQDKRNAVALAQAQVANELQKAAAAKDAEIQALKASWMRARWSASWRWREALSAVEKQRDALANELERRGRRSRRRSSWPRRLAHELQGVAAEEGRRDPAAQITAGGGEVARRLAVTEAVTVVARERDELKNDLNLVVVKKQLERSRHQGQVRNLQMRDRDGEIARLRDMKARLSTKMVGETLEQHCETEFNRIRATAFPRAYFEKDNDARSGSKGDYIFRDLDEAGTEIVSIMFEMKNESDETATKKRNEDFLKELDKDRTEKGCEYAVLVSLLEPESELYNTGIVDVFTATPRCTWCGRSSSSPSSRCCATRR